MTDEPNPLILCTPEALKPTAKPDYLRSLRAQIFVAERLAPNGPSPPTMLAGEDLINHMCVSRRLDNVVYELCLHVLTHSTAIVEKTYRRSLFPSISLTFNSLAV